MDNKKNILFVLSGPSGAGKSTLLSKIVEDGLCKPVIKYSIRENRDEWLDSELNVVVKDDVIHTDINFINTHCNIKYEMYNKTLYGINKEETNEVLKDKNAILIVSNEDAIKKIKTVFGNTVCPVFIWIQDIEIKNLLKRKEYNNLFNQEVCELADNISSCIKKNDKKGQKEYFNKFSHVTKKCFSKEEKYIEFIERCESWINPKFNKQLYSEIIKKDNLKSIYNELCKIIEKYNL
jgi:guanylate kinase